MKLFVFAVFLIVLCIDYGNCFNSDNVRVKRSNETEGFSLKKVTDGVKSFGSKVSNVASKGYEEFKNLFSKDRKVGDYQLNNIDVRVREEEDYEEVGAKKRPKREVKKQETDEMSVDFVLELDEILKDMRVLEITENPDLDEATRENNAELLPGVPIAFALFIAPLKCPDGQKHANGRCRTLV